LVLSIVQEHDQFELTVTQLAAHPVVDMVGAFIELPLIDVELHAQSDGEPDKIKPVPNATAHRSIRTF
jgi:hypothetical protein